jgi:urea carboxylase-associated protein 2
LKKALLKRAARSQAHRFSALSGLVRAVLVRKRDTTMSTFCVRYFRGRACQWHLESNNSVATASEEPLWCVMLAPGEHWSGVLRRGTSLRLTAREDRANVAAMMYNYESLPERYNMPDTLKAQHTAFLTAGCVCYSDMGRILCSITADSCGWHDTICGLSDAAMIASKYGVSRFQEQRNEFFKNGRDSMLNELGKYGLGKRDLIANINFFSRVTVDDAGALQFHERHCRAGDYVDLRFEMNTLLVLSTCPHPLDPEARYRPSRVDLRAWYSGPAPREDACRRRCEENVRGFHNTEMMFLA